MAVLLFALFWVIVATGLVYLGLRSNRRSADAVNTARGGRAYWYVSFAVVVILFGAGLPVVSAIGHSDTSANVPTADISNLTDDEEDGRQLFGRYCKICHTLEAANAVAQVGPNLDSLRPTKELVLDAIHKGRARGNGAMAADLVTGEDAEHVAEFVSLAVGKSEDAEG